jgi:hypothetical protein
MLPTQNEVGMGKFLWIRPQTGHADRYRPALNDERSPPVYEYDGLDCERCVACAVVLLHTTKDIDKSLLTSEASIDIKWLNKVLDFTEPWRDSNTMYSMAEVVSELSFAELVELDRRVRAKYTEAYNKTIEFDKRLKPAIDDFISFYSTDRNAASYYQQFLQPGFTNRAVYYMKIYITIRSWILYGHYLRRSAILYEVLPVQVVADIAAGNQFTTFLSVLSPSEPSLLDEDTATFHRVLARDRHLPDWSDVISSSVVACWDTLKERLADYVWPMPMVHLAWIDTDALSLGWNRALALAYFYSHMYRYLLLYHIFLFDDAITRTYLLQTYAKLEVELNWLKLVETSAPRPSMQSYTSWKIYDPLSRIMPDDTLDDNVNQQFIDDNEIEKKTKLALRAYNNYYQGSFYDVIPEDAPPKCTWAASRLATRQALERVKKTFEYLEGKFPFHMDLKRSHLRDSDWATFVCSLEPEHFVFNCLADYWRRIVVISNLFGSIEVYNRHISTVLDSCGLPAFGENKQVNFAVSWFGTQIKVGKANALNHYLRDAIAASDEQRLAHENWERLVPSGMQFKEDIQYDLYPHGEPETSTQTVERRLKMHYALVRGLDSTSNQTIQHARLLYDEVPQHLREAKMRHIAIVVLGVCYFVLRTGSVQQGLEREYKRLFESRLRNLPPFPWGNK